MQKYNWMEEQFQIKLHCEKINKKEIKKIKNDKETNSDM